MKLMHYNDSLSESSQGTTRTTYLYKVRQTGELVSVEMTLDEKFAREKTGGFITLPDGTEGQIAFREELEKDGLRPGPIASPNQHAKWPMVSVNAGVNPDQIDELRAHWARHNVTGVDVTPEGDVIWNDAGARKADCESRGLYDRNAGYGDPAPKNL
jgi:hypothetical protein